MTFLEIMKDVAKNAGLDVPVTVTTGDPDQVKLSQFINETGRELARRVDWGALRKEITLTGDGTPNLASIAPDYDRLPAGLAVTADMSPVRGSLTADEWFSLAPIEGTPRYFYLKDSRIGLYPYLSVGKAVRIQYQSERWVVEPGTQGFDEMTKDGQETPLDGNLIVTGAIVRWRRHIGKDFADYLEEFEAQLADIARANGGVRNP